MSSAYVYFILPYKTLCRMKKRKSSHAALPLWRPSCLTPSKSLSVTFSLCWFCVPAYGSLHLSAELPLHVQDRPCVCQISPPGSPQLTQLREMLSCCMLITCACACSFVCVPFLLSWYDWYFYGDIFYGGVTVEVKLLGMNE